MEGVNTSAFNRRPIAVLSNEVARKIAAGEVIERPNAVVRELMDNAVDSGADNISVEISGGGINKVRVVDNGMGLSCEDLLACATPHATSKIVSDKDLLTLATLGFRGEALCSIATVATLRIDSGDFYVIVKAKTSRCLSPRPNIKGTIVTVEGLFENFPARRLFLKRPATESSLCRDTFIQKALPRVDIAFRLLVDGVLKYDLRRVDTLADRFCALICPDKDRKLFYELKGVSSEKSAALGEDKLVPDWSYTLVIGEPSIYRNDRKDIYVFVNGRRIWEYSLMQAIESGCQGFFPNGVHPIAAIYANINSRLVDFNIHPAKKEVRFKDISGLHSSIAKTVGSFFKAYTRKEGFNSNYTMSPATRALMEKISFIEAGDTEGESYKGGTPDIGYTSPYGAGSNVAGPATSSSTGPSAITNGGGESTDSFIYIGQCLGTFILVQKGDLVYFIDQHAAHERIRYNKILNNSYKERQNMLIPYIIYTNKEEDDKYLRGIREELERNGYIIEPCGEGKWELISAPMLWCGTEEDIQKGLLEHYCSPKDLLHTLASTAACKGAVKDGDVLGEPFAISLAKAALELKDPHCPHGRPIWTTISKKQLYTLVRRT